jgi:Glycosyl hydrolase family 76
VRGLLAALALVACLGPAGAAAGTGKPSTLGASDYLALAEAGLAKIGPTFWNASLGWYDQRPVNAARTHKPLASLWSAFPLFEAVDAAAIADPTPANVAAVRAFATGAERYFNPNLRPVGGYAYYPGTTNPREHTYFDDNGWWEMAYLDAYRATGDPGDLTDAERAFRFIAVSGWNPNGGGVWWETLHLHETSEPLAAEIYTGFGLYLATHEATYLLTAEKFLAWANAHSWNAKAMLYARNETDPTVLDYVEGPMIGAELELCQIRGVRGTCVKAEQLGEACLAAFPQDADWTPAADAVYLRFVLELYQADGNPRWYDLVAGNAERALRLARTDPGFYFRRWDGRPFPEHLLQPDAATLSLFAWLAGVEPPTIAGSSIHK